METYHNSTDEKRKKFDDVYMLGSLGETTENQKWLMRNSLWATFWVGHAAGYVDGCVDMYEIGYKDGCEEDREGRWLPTDAEAGTHTL